MVQIKSKNQVSRPILRSTYNW